MIARTLLRYPDDYGKELYAHTVLTATEANGTLVDERRGSKENGMSRTLSSMIPVTEGKLMAWWNHEEQETPCLMLTTPPEPQEPVDDLDDYWFNVDGVLRRAMREIETRQYYGVALPYHWPDWGAATFAGMLGAPMQAVDARTFWAASSCPTLGAVLDVGHDEQSRFARTVWEVTRRSVAMSRDHHFVASYPIVGIADTLASLYGTVPLLLAMVEQPEAVHAAMQHLTRLWLREFDRVETIIESAGNQGNMNWMGIWAPGRTCATQEDYSCMISDDMFREFCLPPLVDLIDSLDYAMYHLDGPDAISHVDTLLGIRNLRAIQWIPGAGNEDMRRWYELLRHILSHGKSVQVNARVEEIDELVSAVGPKGLMITNRSVTGEQAEDLLSRYPQDR